MNSLLHDLHLAIRRLYRQRTFSVTAIVTLALATAPCIVAFSLLHSVALKPLPFDEPERLVRVWELNPESGRFSTSEPNFADWQETQRSFSDLAAYRQDRVILGFRQVVEQISSTQTTPNLFTLLGTREAAHGRTLQPSDGAESTAVVLSHSLARRLGDAASLIGQRLEIDGQSRHVVGVMPPAFDFPSGTDLWLPKSMDRNGDRGSHWLASIARLDPGIELPQAQQDMDRVAAALAAEYPASNDGWGIELQAMSDWLVPSSVRRAMVMLQSAVVLVFLLACANLINLLAARATMRHRELALRACLGADRGRLVREGMTEAVALALPGVTLGLWMAWWLLPVVLRLAPADIPRLDEAAIEPAVGLFAAALATFAVLLLGAAPGASSSGEPMAALRGGRATSTLVSRFRRSLVTVQIGLGMAVLVLAGLLVTSLGRLSSVDPGFETHNVWSGEINLAASEDAAATLLQVQDRWAALPGIRVIGATSTSPFGSMYSFANDVTPVERIADAPTGGLMQSSWRIASPGFFESMSIPRLEGRSFDDRDGAESSPKNAVVSQTFARQMWPGRDSVVGRQFFFGGTDGTPWTVIGVVADIRDVQIDAPPGPSMYLPHRAAPFPSMAVTIHSQSTGLPLEALSAALHEIDPRIPKVEFQSFTQLLHDATARQRFHAHLLACLSVLAVILSAGGVYSLMAFEAEQLQHSTGIRMALGAEARDVVGAFLSQGIGRAMLGALLGSLLTLASTPLVSELLYQTPMLEPRVYASALLLLFTTAVLAAWLPARRLARVEPRNLLASQ